MLIVRAGKIRLSYWSRFFQFLCYVTLLLPQSFAADSPLRQGIVATLTTVERQALEKAGRLLVIADEIAGKKTLVLTKEQHDLLFEIFFIVSKSQALDQVFGGPKKTSILLIRKPFGLREVLVSKIAAETLFGPSEVNLYDRSRYNTMGYLSDYIGSVPKNFEVTSKVTIFEDLEYLPPFMESAAIHKLKVLFDQILHEKQSLDRLVILLADEKTELPESLLRRMKLISTANSSSKEFCRDLLKGPSGPISGTYN